MKALRTLLVAVILLLAAYGVMQWGASAANAIGATPTPAAVKPAPAIVVEAMEAGVLYCPETTSVYTRTAIYGYVVYCN